MRRVLVNRAVARKRQKRGGEAVQVSLGQAGDSPHRTADLVALDEALDALAQVDERKSRLVELRFFGGLDVEEAAMCSASLSNRAPRLGFGAGVQFSRVERPGGVVRTL